MTRVAVLASGSGTNLQAILDHQSVLGSAASAHVVLVASDHADAGSLTRARDAGVTALALDRSARTTGLAAILAAHRIELLALAGYLRLVPPDVVSHFRGRLLNVHPALLPEFGGPGMYGSRVHEAVIARGARLTGPTVHFVDERYDEGPIIAQWPVPVLPSDTADGVAARVLAVEHLLYPRIVEAVSAGLIHLDRDDQVRYEDGIDPKQLTVTADVGAATAHLDAILRRSRMQSTLTSELGPLTSH
jgi:formyltetrahydrofolate-dependent phosphoribosylglycinamide formyltransferase